MGYLGTPIDTNNTFQSLQGKRFSGNASTTDFTLDVAPTSTLDIEVFVENVRQDPNSAYTLSGTTLAFAAAPGAGTNNIYVIHQAKAVGTISAGAGTVNADSMDNTVISGHDALTSRPADTDEFLVSDAGTIKRVDFSHIKGSIGQVVQTVKTDTFSTSSSSFTAITGLAVAITPSATSSKILIRTVISYGGDQNLYGFAKILRGSTDILVGDAGASSQIRATFPMMNTDGDGPGEIYKAHVASSEFLDSPSSTSELTYSVHVSTYTTKNIFINRESNDANAGYNGRYTSTITAMEVLA